MCDMYMYTIYKYICYVCLSYIHGMYMYKLCICRVYVTCIVVYVYHAYIPTSYYIPDTML